MLIRPSSIAELDPNANTGMLQSRYAYQETQVSFRVIKRLMYNTELGRGGWGWGGSGKDRGGERGGQGGKVVFYDHCVEKPLAGLLKRSYGGTETM
jgi:hypothetical protein